MVEKRYILAEIQRTAQENGGRALGKGASFEATGTAEPDWPGRFWPGWRNAVREAGLEPNSLQERFSDAHLLDALAAVCLRLGHFPTTAEMRLARREDRAFPNDKVYGRFGNRSQLAEALATHFHGRPGFEAV